MRLYCQYLRILLSLQGKKMIMLVLRSLVVTLADNTRVCPLWYCVPCLVDSVFHVSTKFWKIELTRIVLSYRSSSKSLEYENNIMLLVLHLCIHLYPFAQITMHFGPWHRTLENCRLWQLIILLFQRTDQEHIEVSVHLSLTGRDTSNSR